MKYLKRWYAMPSSPTMFGALNKSTIRSWFEANGRTLRPRPQAAVTALKNGEQVSNIMRLRVKGMWEGHRDVEVEFID